MRGTGILLGLGKGLLGFLVLAVRLEKFPQIIPALGIIGLQLYRLAQFRSASARLPARDRELPKRL